MREMMDAGEAVYAERSTAGCAPGSATSGQCAKGAACIHLLSAAPLATDHELPNRTSATDSAATSLHVVCINPPVPHPIEASSQVAEEFGAVGCRDSC